MALLKETQMSSNLCCLIKCGTVYTNNHTFDSSAPFIPFPSPFLLVATNSGGFLTVMMISSVIERLNSQDRRDDNKMLLDKRRARFGEIKYFRDH